MIPPDRLPTIQIGAPASAEAARTVQGAVQEIIARLNEVPDDHRHQVLCSVIASACCNQDDPHAALLSVITVVGRAIDHILAIPGGTA